jgi:hypothetical protein
MNLLRLSLAAPCAIGVADVNFNCTLKSAPVGRHDRAMTVGYCAYWRIAGVIKRANASVTHRNSPMGLSREALQFVGWP